MAEPEAKRGVEARSDAVAAYKRIAQDVLDRRPSGTRQRLADALQRNRSFVTQIINPAYGVPIPSRHVATIFDVCRFSPAERAAFLDAYRQAHPRSPVAVAGRPRTRHAHLMLPDFGSDASNQAFDELVQSFLLGVGRLATAQVDERRRAEDSQQRPDRKAEGDNP
jgi:hypothetical protein